MILKEQFTEEYVKAKCLKDDPGQHLQTSVVPWPPSSPDLNKGVYPDISRLRLSVAQDDIMAGM